MELWTAFILGLAGSLHCAGMCGPIALALPMTGHGFSSYALGRVAYNLGRLAAYCLLGVAFGLVGKNLVLAGAQRWVSIGAGVVILMSLIASPQHALTAPLCGIVAWLKSGLASLLRYKSVASLLLLGCLNGCSRAAWSMWPAPARPRPADCFPESHAVIRPGHVAHDARHFSPGRTVRAPLRLKFQKLIGLSAGDGLAPYFARPVSGNPLPQPRSGRQPRPAPAALRHAMQLERERGCRARSFGVPPKTFHRRYRTLFGDTAATGTSRQDADWCDRDGRAPK